MQYVVAIDRNKSITKAADEMYISQPALSKFLKNLEIRLGFQVFSRVGNQIRTTREGEVYVAYAKRICEIENRMNNELTDMVFKNCGRIRFALPDLRSSYLLPRILPAFKRMYPKVEIQLFERHSQYLEQMLLENTVDLAVLNGTVKSTGVCTELLEKNELVLVVPNDHPMAGTGVRVRDKRYPQVDIAQFREDSFILQPPDQRTRQIADSIFADVDITPSVMLITRSIDTAIQIVAEGCGVCFAAEAYARRNHCPHAPVLLSLDHPFAHVDLSLAYTQGVYMPPYFMAFVDIIRKAFASGE